MQAIIGSEFSKKVIPLIDNAKKSISIVVFDWRWYANDIANPVQLFNQALVRACKRGVEVYVIANSLDVIATLQKCGVQAKKLFTGNLVHSKLMIIDECIVIVGSHNYTQSAFTTNYEISALIDGKAEAADFINYFNAIWAHP